MYRTIISTVQFEIICTPVADNDLSVVNDYLSVVNIYLSVVNELFP